MNKIIEQIEKRQPLFQKISRNIYLMAVKDGFLNAMPVILFSSIFILIAALSEVFGVVLPVVLSDWLWKIYDYSMGIIGLLVAATTARNLAGSMNRSMPKGKVINETSVILAAIVSFLLLSTTKADGAFDASLMGTEGLLSSYVSAFITVNMYKFCIIRDITIKMPKEVPGSISQNFRDVFPFSFSVLAAAVIDLLSRNFIGVPFAQVIAAVLSPLFEGAESYFGLAIIWLLIPMFWFVGVHGPSVVKPGLSSALYGNTEANLQLMRNGEHPHYALTENFGNFVGELGGTGATFIVPFIFIFLMKSKQLKAVGRTSVVPVMFAVNEPLLFAAPIVLNPYFFIPFIISPVVNVLIGKFFINVLGMNGFMYVLPWATPGPIGTVLATGFQPISIVFSILLLAVDFSIYYPFVKAYDRVLLAEEAENAEKAREEELTGASVVPEGEVALAAATSEGSATVTTQEYPANKKKIDKEISVLVLCAGAGTSAMLANALEEGAEETGVSITASAGAYGSHYEIMSDFDAIVLAPQVASYYEDIKSDTDRLGIKLIRTKGAQYIELTQNPKEAIEFILKEMD